MTDNNVYTRAYLAQQEAKRQNLEAQRQDLERAIRDAEQRLQEARWDLVVFESEMGGEADNER